MLPLFGLLVLISNPFSHGENAVRFWQHRLGLEQWRILAIVVPIHELHANTVGRIDVFPENKTAVIRILREEVRVQIADGAPDS